MKIKTISIWTLASLILLSACKTEIDTPTPSKGSADFTKYIAVGNSLTAGYADGGLSLSGQQNSFPNIIAQQMKLAGGGEFKQALFPADKFNGSGFLKITGFNANGTPITAPETSNLAYRTTTLLVKYTDEVQNLGIPGMSVNLAIVPQYSGTSGNPYFERLLVDAKAGTTSYATFIQGRNHTFFSSWLGNNDVLGWATNGGVTEDAKSVLTSKSTFTTNYTNIINTLTAQNQKGVMATIPDATTFPYFNTVTVPILLATVQAANPTVKAIYVGTNTGYKIATSRDLITLTFPTALLGKPTTANATVGTIDSPYPYGLHPLNPITNKYVLDSAEVVMAKDYTNSFNNTIKTLANAKGLALFDAYAYLSKLSVVHTDANGKAYTGEWIDGINVNTSYIKGNAFSIDGVHLTYRGHAVVANAFIDAINAKYGSTIPKVSIANYGGIKFP